MFDSARASCQIGCLSGGSTLLVGVDMPLDWLHLVLPPRGPPPSSPHGCCCVLCLSLLLLCNAHAAALGGCAAALTDADHTTAAAQPDCLPPMRCK